jgi:hypothetical protein
MNFCGVQKKSIKKATWGAQQVKHYLGTWDNPYQMTWVPMTLWLCSSSGIDHNSTSSRRNTLPTLASEDMRYFTKDEEEHLWDEVQLYNREVASILWTEPAMIQENIQAFPSTAGSSTTCH